MATIAFEERFRGVQRDLVTLCLGSAAELDVREVYFLAAVEGRMTSFEAFFRIEGVEGLPSLAELLSEAYAAQITDAACHELEGLRKLCVSVGRPCPTQIVGHYVVGSGRYTASYEYDPQVVRSGGTGRDADGAYWAWHDAVATARKRG